jgi:HEAT repeat protein
VARLAESNEHLMDRGQLPLSAAKTEQLLSKFSDTSAPDRDRLQALRLLRRNDALGDDALQQALQWLQGSTNAATRTRLVQQLSGLTNAALRDPLLALATTDANAEVRQRAISGLRAFVDDPQVEAQLWGMLQGDATAGIRRQLRDVLTDGPLSEARLESLRQRAVSGTATLDERTLAWEALRGSGNSNPEVSASLAQLAMTTTDTSERLRLFEAFNSASDPAFIPSLVQGLQDPSPQVRARAADALSDFRSDPAVAEWFQYVAANDTDAAVRRQAARAMEQRQGRGGNGGPGGPPRSRGQGRP